MANVQIRSVRNDTDGEVTVINLENLKKPGHKVTILSKSWGFYEIVIPRCESISDWQNNRRISVELNHPKVDNIWLFQKGERLYYCSTPEFSDMLPVAGDAGVAGDENRYLAINEDGSFVMVKASFWLHSEWSPQ